MWLTEVAAGSSNGSYVAEFASELMSTVDGLSNRAPASSGGFEFVSHVSWFSEYFFPAFNVTGYRPKPFEGWASSLFNPFGPAPLPGASCTAASPAQCKADRCSKGAPFECTSGQDVGGCAASAAYWKTAAGCSACIDVVIDHAISILGANYSTISEGGFVGLTNQGATCYLNSLVQ
eukprot:gene19476-18962_t